jgi:hypothetical protein
MALLCDHTGKFPVLSTTGIAITAAEAMAAFTRYLTAAGLEWKWAAENLVFTDLTPSTLGHLLNTGYSVGGKNPRTVGALAYGLMKVRRTEGFAARRAKNNLAILTAEANGGAFFAEGVTDKAGNAIKYANEKAAQKAWCRTHIGPKWWETNKTENLGMAVTQRSTPFTEVSEATEKVRVKQAPATVAAPAVISTIAPTTVAPTTIAPTTIAIVPAEVQSTSTASVTASQAIAMAKALGSQAKTEAGALTYLAGKGVNL